MAQFVITPKSTIQFGPGLDPIKPGRENERVVAVNVTGITPTTLFTRFSARSILADQLNRAYGTTGFTPENVIRFGGQFQIRTI